MYKPTKSQLRALVKTLLKNNGKPLELTDNQLEIAMMIVCKEHPRNQVIAPTQYGKSMTVAGALLLCATIDDDRFTILAPSEKKAQIIMGQVIEHAFDDEFFTSRLELDRSTTLDRLKRERSRNHITFLGGGGIQTLTLDSRNMKRNIEAAMGFGGQNLILDESSMIDDPLYATVKRMLGGYKYSETFLLEIGNPFHRNHFYRTWHDPKYHKLFIDYKLAMAEGRFSPEFIEEMRNEAFFYVFYECLFPDEDAIDSRGYRQLLSTEDIEGAFVGLFDPDEATPMTLGVDVAAGGDFNTYVIRQGQTSWIESFNHSNDTMTNVNETIRIIEKYQLAGTAEHHNCTDTDGKQWYRLIKPEAVSVDDIGVGRGVTDRLHELGYMVNAVSVGVPASDPTKYKNLKAENAWKAEQWIKAGGKLRKDGQWQQLTWIKYKVSTDKVLQCEPKEDLKARTGKSPDFADAFMLTFTQPKPEPNVRWLD